MDKIKEQVKNAPLTKEQSREQFYALTEQLGLKHSFDFDEAWEIGEEIRKRKDFREKITTLHEQMVEGGALVGEELHALNPTKHTFAGGCYIREIFNPANELLVTKIHKKEHPFFLMKGKMSILTEDGIKTIEAPHHGVTKPGTKRAIFTHEDCVFVTVHATDCTTPEDVEEEVIAKDFQDPALALSAMNELSTALGIEVELIKDKIT
tara:strand:+ start:41 stop:664 length:624 start_codon:yes stop_codon:yes gene_type:complete